MPKVIHEGGPAVVQLHRGTRSFGVRHTVFAWHLHKGNSLGVLTAIRYLSPVVQLYKELKSLTCDIRGPLAVVHLIKEKVPLGVLHTVSPPSRRASAQGKISNGVLPTVTA